MLSFIQTHNWQIADPTDLGVPFYLKNSKHRCSLSCFQVLPKILENSLSPAHIKPGFFTQMFCTHKSGPAEWLQLKFALWSLQCFIVLSLCSAAGLCCLKAIFFSNLFIVFFFWFLNIQSIQKVQKERATFSAFIWNVNLHRETECHVCGYKKKFNNKNFHTKGVVCIFATFVVASHWIWALTEAPLSLINSFIYRMSN